jgi:tetratricopeptide (TPR) repeat protein
VSDEWFRSPHWDPATRADFEQRLSRARGHSRSQYLCIKALALREAGLLDEARNLLLRVTMQHSQTADAAFATELLGGLAREQGQLGAAESYYRSVLQSWPSLNGTSWTVEVSLAELLTARGGDAACNEALQLLQSRLNRQPPMLDNDLFRWHVALARVAGQLGDTETQQRAARTALNLVDRGPQFPRHPTIGLVNADNRTLAWLRQLAANGD